MKEKRWLIPRGVYKIQNLTRAWAFGTNFLFQFDPQPDDKELKYFQLFWSGSVDNTRWKISDPMLIFLCGNRP
jgi:hypothetical protein